MLTVNVSAQADHHKTIPTQAQVDQASATAAAKAGDVAALQADLAVANSRLHAAADRAEIAAEAYNGAMWRLQQAQQATADAKAAVADALAHVDEQRAGIAQLVTQSYQDGALTGVTAIIGGEDPSAVMSRLGVVQSAGDSMQARFDQYSALNALARVAQAKAETAETEQQSLAQKAEQLRNDAAEAANEAASQTAAIANQKHQLIVELAKAQKISVELATQRQEGLEKKAEEVAAHAAQVAAHKAKNQADDAKDQQQLTQDQLAELGVEGGWDLPGLEVPAGTSDGAKAAIEFAKAQLGEPYVWAAAGPDAWDCSGLTMMAWRQGGISLPHYSAAQYQQTKHITASQLKAGDLVFWGTSPNTIHHVALYIGNDLIIQAPHTGDVVKVSPLYDSAPDYYGRP
ncbi:MAG: C40 family peptidase [Propionibacteriales bacterium]|nr:C40 family peptidase [Propionibacteriales bacterium]